MTVKRKISKHTRNAQGERRKTYRTRKTRNERYMNTNKTVTV